MCFAVDLFRLLHCITHADVLDLFWTFFGPSSKTRPKVLLQQDSQYTFSKITL